MFGSADRSIRCDVHLQRLCILGRHALPGAACLAYDGAAMAEVNRENPVSPPPMHAFRAAHEAGDATSRIDLRTEGGDRVIAGRRLRPRQVITEQVLRREVARDLDALLNTIAMESAVDMTDAPYARKSVLNFGLPDISTLTIDASDMKRIPEEIR